MGGGELLIFSWPFSFDLNSLSLSTFCIASNQNIIQ